MNLAPKVETAELSDADLDLVSGGQAGGSPADTGAGAAAGFATGLYLEAGPVGIGAGIGGGLSPAGLAADANLHVGMH